LLRRTPNL